MGGSCCETEFQLCLCVCELNLVSCNACIVRKFKAGDRNAWVMIGDSLDSGFDHDHERQLKAPFKATSAAHSNNNRGK